MIRRGMLVAVVALSAASDPAAGQTAFDGTWVGRGTLTASRGRGTDCGPESFANRLTVQNGRLSMVYSAQAGIRFDGPVAADGSFSIASGQSRFAGRFAGDGMAASFTNPACERAWRFRRQAGG